MAFDGKDTVLLERDVPWSIALEDGGLESRLLLVDGASKMLLEDGNDLLIRLHLATASDADLLLESTGAGDPSNATATEDSENKYNICQRTGFKIKPGQLVEEWDGVKVRADSWEPRSLQDLVRVRAEELHGAYRPEPTDQFIANSIAPEDL
jgi:hypothetical protein